YCTRWCPGCRMAREFFETHGIEYSEVNVHANQEAAERVRDWANGNVTTPTFDIKGTIIVDYDLPAVKKALGMD
ncbi:MAG: glutaredoxin family protein, partial [Anaerolineales bacterium]|nr:glutaredoxin family protein [Anaerolineales bacterium]